MSSCSVSTLFDWQGPTTIGGSVRLRAVDAVDAVFGGWPWPHVGEEFGETPVPAFAYSDSLASVSSVIRSILSVTSGFHVVPSVVFYWVLFWKSGLTAHWNLLCLSL